MNPDDISSILYAAYKDVFQESDRQCTSKLYEEWQSSKPLKGKKILLNCHMTLSSLILVNIAISAGATIDTTTTPNLVVHPEPIRVLRKAGISFYENGIIPEEKQHGYYDIVFDCGAELLQKITPKYGMVELTHTDPALYRDIKFPVITVDNSKTKLLETSYGTGNGFVQALMFEAQNRIGELMQLFAQMSQGQCDFFHLYDIMLTMQNYGRLFTERNYVLFGYGKVGNGIAAALVSAGVEKKNICIVDVSETVCSKAKQDGFTTVHLDKTNQERLVEVKQYLSKAFCAVTATGCEGAISSLFERKDFAGIPFLANMGTPDEFGPKFIKEDILNGKKLFNFILPAPTEMIYLDPIFSILLRAGQQFLTDEMHIKYGLQNVSALIDDAVLSSWHTYNQHTSWKHLEYQHQVENYLRNVSCITELTFIGIKKRPKRKTHPTYDSSPTVRPRIISKFFPPPRNVGATSQILAPSAATSTFIL